MAETKRMADTHISTLQEDLKTRLLLHYEEVWDSREMSARRALLGSALLAVRECQEYTDTEIHRAVQDDTVPNFFESVGLHLQKGHLDTDMVSSILGYYAMRYGQALAPFLVEDGRVRGDEELWSGFLYLHKTLRQFERQKRGQDRPDFPSQEINRFLREEVG